MTEDDLKTGQCYGQPNPLWGRSVLKLNRQLQSSVLDFERYDATVISIDPKEGLTLNEHVTLAATTLINQSYQPVKEALFLKLRAMAMLARATAGRGNDEALGNAMKLLEEQGLLRADVDYARQYAHDMTSLLKGVYDVVDVHK